MSVTLGQFFEIRLLTSFTPHRAFKLRPYNMLSLRQTQIIIAKIYLDVLIISFIVERIAKQFLDIGKNVAGDSHLF